MPKVLLVLYLPGCCNFAAVCFCVRKDFYGLHSLCKFLWPHSSGAMYRCTDAAGPFSLHLCKHFCRMPSSGEGRPSLACALVEVGLHLLCPTGRTMPALISFMVTCARTLLLPFLSNYTNKSKGIFHFIRLKCADWIAWLLSWPVCSIIFNKGWAFGKVPYIFKIVPYIIKILIVNIPLFLKHEMLY